LVECCKEKLLEVSSAGLLSKVQLRTEKLLDEIANDPTFRPRIILAPGRRVVVRARNRDEANLFLHILVAGLMQGLVDKDYSGWTQMNTGAGLEHHAVNSVEKIFPRLGETDTTDNVLELLRG
jgi:hypothetical protein